MMINFLRAAFVIIGLTIFLVGVDNGITPIGNTMGSVMTKTNKVWIVAASGLVLGFVISIAEPDLHILADQVQMVSSGVISKISIVLVVSLGLAVMIAIGLLRIVFNIALNKLLAVTYGVIFVLALFTSPEFLAISVDSSGATTGALTVPFMLALAYGVAKLKKASKSSEADSFGLVGIASSGAILGVMLLSIIRNMNEVTGTLESNGDKALSILGPFIQKIPETALEVFVALAPILLIFMAAQALWFKLSKITMRKIMFGMTFTFVGLVIFLVGVNAGFMEVGSVVGYKLAALENKAFVIIVGFILGMVTVIAEPAVYVLTHQIEDVTSGYVKRRVVLVTLSLGIALAVSLSIVRILVPGVQLWHFLLPGFFISIVMSFFVPSLFVGIAFDAGGVASGPMTATFILAFAQGAAAATEGANVMIDGFGVIAMVAMTPLLALQILGFIFKVKSRKGGIKDNE